MPLELHDLNWDLGFGHIQGALLPWGQPQWVPRIVDAPITHTREDLPGDVGTAEVCFRRDDGEIVTVLRDSIWAQQHRDRGLLEIPCSAPIFSSTPPAQSSWPAPPVVVPSDASQEIPGDEGVLHGEGGWIDTALDWYGAYTDAVTPPIFNYGGPSAGPAAVAGPATVMQTANGTCGKSPCVCGVDSCGRPALIDPRTGKRCYRRRRRRLLTEGDFNDLMRIATLPNKQNVTVALAKAIGRR